MRAKRLRSWLPRAQLASMYATAPFAVLHAAGCVRGYSSMSAQIADRSIDLESLGREVAVRMGFSLPEVAALTKEEAWFMAGFCRLGNTKDRGAFVRIVKGFDAPPDFRLATPGELTPRRFHRNTFLRLVDSFTWRMRAYRPTTSSPLARDAAPSNSARQSRVLGDICDPIFSSCTPARSCTCVWLRAAAATFNQPVRWPCTAARTRASGLTAARLRAACTRLHQPVR